MTAGRRRRLNVQNPDPLGFRIGHPRSQSMTRKVVANSAKTIAVGGVRPACDVFPYGGARLHLPSAKPARDVTATTNHHRARE